MSLEILISLAAIFLALTGFLATYFGFISKLQGKIGDIQGLIGKFSHLDVTNLIQRLTAIETKIGNTNFTEMSMNIAEIRVKTDLFWGAVEHVVRDLIKQPIHFRKDDLIDRFPDLTYEELCELRDIISEEMKELVENKKDKAMAYALMKARIDQVLWDKNNNLDFCKDLRR